MDLDLEEPNLFQIRIKPTTHPGSGNLLIIVSIVTGESPEQTLGSMSQVR